MNKTMIVLAAALAVATTGFVPAAHARGRGHFHFHVWTPTFTPTYERETYERPIVRKKIVVQKVYVEKATVVKYTDGQGRKYDPASKAWFDGKGQCWSGSQPFVFKGGSWLYGSKPWKQVNGTWQTSAAEPPAPVDCSSVAAFAGKIQAQPEAGRKEVGQAKPAPVTTAANKAQPTTAVPAKPSEAKAKPECKRYFPSVGEMISVPCTE
jgi:hypothetical protein